MQAGVASNTTPGAPRFLRELSVVDVLVAAYHATLLLAAVLGAGPERAWCIGWCATLLSLHVVAVGLVRGRVLKNERVAGVVYRLIAYGTVQASYFILRALLPTARSTVLDGALFAFDLRVIGVEPALWLDAWITPARTEWFSFFYFGYFPLLAVHVLPFLLASRRQRLFAEFAMAVMILFCTAHVLYMVVPGYGPIRYLAPMFAHELPHGRFYDLVLKTVAAGGAQKDIFPSMHTAGPTLLALFSFRHRDKRPFMYTWPITAVFAANVVGATLFLRWHWAIDVLVGLSLAAASVALAARFSRREGEHRARIGATPAWPAIWSPIAEPDAEPHHACPVCGGEGVAVLYAGLPMRRCADERCATAWGWFSFVPAVLRGRPYVRYEGSYLRALATSFTRLTRRTRDSHVPSVPRTRDADGTGE